MPGCGTGQIVSYAVSSSVLKVPPCAHVRPCITGRDTAQRSTRRHRCRYQVSVSTDARSLLAPKGRNIAMADTAHGLWPLAVLTTALFGIFAISFTGLQSSAWLLIAVPAAITALSVVVTALGAALAWAIFRNRTLLPGTAGRPDRHGGREPPRRRVRRRVRRGRVREARRPPHPRPGLPGHPGQRLGGQTGSTPCPCSSARRRWWWPDWGRGAHDE